MDKGLELAIIHNFDANSFIFTANDDRFVWGLKAKQKTGPTEMPR